MKVLNRDTKEVKDINIDDLTIKELEVWAEITIGPNSALEFNGDENTFEVDNTVFGHMVQAFGVVKVPVVDDGLAGLPSPVVEDESSTIEKEQ